MPRCGSNTPHNSFHLRRLLSTFESAYVALYQGICIIPSLQALSILALHSITRVRCPRYCEGLGIGGLLKVCQTLLAGCCVELGLGDYGSWCLMASSSSYSLDLKVLTRGLLMRGQGLRWAAAPLMAPRM